MFAVGFLYRHAIELNLKAIVARTDEFRVMNSAGQRDALNEHSLPNLWNRLKPYLTELSGAEHCATVEVQILELHDLDESSAAFRYPFRIRAPRGWTQGEPAGRTRTSPRRRLQPCRPAAQPLAR